MLSENECHCANTMMLFNHTSAARVLRSVNNKISEQKIGFLGSLKKIKKSNFGEKKILARKK
jgi:hypothetical protein